MASDGELWGEFDTVIRQLIGMMLVWIIGGQQKADEYLMTARAKRQHELGEGLIEAGRVSWQADMVLRFERNEPDIIRRLRLQDLAIAMIHYTPADSTRSSQ